MSTGIEARAENGQNVYVVEVEGYLSVLYTLAGLEVKNYEFSVYKGDSFPDDPDATHLENSAPLHIEFFDTAEEAVKAAETALGQINAGTFNYKPPNISF